MTRSEKKKVQFEKLKQKEAEKEQVCVTVETIKETCSDCEHCKKLNTTIDEEYPKEKWKCLRKARQDLDITKDCYNGNILSMKIGVYAYGVVCGKCGYLTFMRFSDDK